ncbi:HAMP domain-containing protein [Phycicoccus endophyticus]|uniref:histidine kinase n=1 Tax=Phycicoccus endophyticus TaxID=1690220 RepID=A0A7G9R1K3_9MICO|nr:HAMP domain-containing sensor histidine kinase [Phycicoccus endophyticus]NHI18732.1 HAMP domain-containing protein [Phycicoccus endophyticus]QNN49478.1 HAMP domain-containing protein [Phycicoccus endophyticus]GGL36933.1 two-component sensor histidine kinase [Phycicoccus endophyticus]
MTSRPRIPEVAYHPSRWTLRTKLIAGVLVLFTVVMLATSALTVLETRRYLEAQLDESLQSALLRAGDRRGVYEDDGDGPAPRRSAPPGAPGGDNVLVLGLTEDGTVATDTGGYSLNQVILPSGEDGTLDADQIERLSAVEPGETVRVDVGDGVGEYLVTARTLDDGSRFIVGVSTRPVDELLGKLLALVVGGTVVGLVLVGVGGAVVIRRSLAPLDRVAATARQVSALQLDQGDVSLAVRVPDDDADGRDEVGQVGLALNTMLDDVEQALQARQESEMRVRQFVADASHELRTPLASIRGYAELTRRESDPVPQTVTHAIGRVESEALRMQELVEDLLLLARLDSGRPLEREPVDLSLLAMNAVSDAHAASPGHAWELDLPEEPVEVTGDGARLHQILANLLANARTHTPSGTRVVTRLRPEGSMVRISVSDNGPGIPSTLQPKVFERFTRGDDSRSRARGSTGLGLSIVAAVGQAHGGRVEVTSEPGATTFSVLLPAA